MDVPNDTRRRMLLSMSVCQLKLLIILMHVGIMRIFDLVKPGRKTCAGPGGGGGDQRKWKTFRVPEFEGHKMRE